MDIGKFINKYFWFSILIFSLPAVLALLVPGYYGASDDLHIGWLYEMDRVLRMGQFPPRYVPDLSFGFGYPLFDFFFPFSFYLGELFHLAGFGLVDSVKGVFFLSIPLSALTMYLLLRQFSGNIVGLAGALIYVYAPYRANDIYNRGDIGESLSFVFLPLIATAIFRIKKVKWVGIGALSLACLILTHNIAAYMFLPPVILLGFLHWFFNRSSGLGTITLVLLGLLISIYFWLPAIVDSDLMKHSTQFNYYDNFPSLKQLITPYWGYGASQPGSNSGMSFFIGIPNLAIFVVGVALLIIYWKKYSIKQRLILLWSAFLFVGAFFMMNIRSTFIWQNVPYLPFFQFPWRFLILTTFASSIFVITLEKLTIKWAKGLILLVSCGVVLLSMFMFRPHDFLGRMDDYYLKRYIPYPEVSKEYYQIQEEGLILPKNTLARPDKLYPRIWGEAQISVWELSALDSRVEIVADKNTSVNFNKYLFPGWVGLLDGRNVTLSAGLPYGQIAVSIPPGRHNLVLTFEETQRNKILDAISIISIIAAIMFIGKPSKLFMPNK